MSVDQSCADDEHERVIAAVHDEVARWGIDRFDVGAMAHRHGLDIAAIQQRWPDSDTLVLEALARRPGVEQSLPDTGSLRTDLFALAVGMAAMVTSDAGRRLHGGHMIADSHVASVEVRRSAWRSRADGLRVVFERAGQRGELRDGIDHFTALELLFAPINMRALYTGEPVDDAYCRTVADLVYRAVSAA
ncbi:TetR/AcrR family transcriptional regulator C-terminal ligand-binding domain-containing protein [Mycobacterium sp. SMC-8]|uniref:TetR-like C-terminal domain-containing protein n=1 Tax=Mycobacterium sp. SMC-8 TaxID=2857060 RepID=UPI0021B34ECC|nr:TetR-like C-terminal domain-containing protein [Mycobacterium sp. SMC-8]UXA14532.1 TetR/AcrR family transcriptional regulator C-terminal ligand-binding domain-containing protein [Mycobacterium sp. SMC-8]